MTNEQFKRECQYQLAISILQTMKGKDFLTSDEFRIIDAILLEKYRPLLGSLYSDKISENFM